MEMNSPIDEPTIKLEILKSLYAGLSKKGGVIEVDVPKRFAGHFRRYDVGYVGSNRNRIRHFIFMAVIMRSLGLITCLIGSPSFFRQEQIKKKLQQSSGPYIPALAFNF